MKKDNNVLFGMVVLVLLISALVVFTLLQALRTTKDSSISAVEPSAIPLSIPIEDENATYLGYQIPPTPSSRELEESIVKADEERRVHSEEAIHLKSQIKADAIRARMEYDEQKDREQIESAQVITSDAAMTTTPAKADSFVAPKTPLPTREERKEMESRGVISF